MLIFMYFYKDSVQFTVHMCRGRITTYFRQRKLLAVKRFFLMQNRQRNILEDDHGICCRVLWLHPTLSCVRLYRDRRKTQREVRMGGGVEAKCLFQCYKLIVTSSKASFSSTNSSWSRQFWKSTLRERRAELLELTLFYTLKCRINLTFHG